MARGKNSQLSGGRALAHVTQKDALTGDLLQKIIQAINSLADNTGAAAVGKLPPPDPIDSHQVQGAYDSETNTTTVSGETLHFTLTHNSALKKGVNYISEIDTDPNFSRPHPIDHGTSRTGFVNLPALDNDGADQVYYLRTLAQYPGSNPNKPTVFGGVNGPTKIKMTGTSRASLLPAQGSGTAANGQQGGKGMGVVLNRPAPGPKRNLK